MELTFFTTCGRGLDDFVKDEIREKISNVGNVRSLGEGKITFVIKSPEVASSSKATQGQVLNKSLGTMSKVNSIDGIWKMEIITAVYRLKLVERIFILIHSEDVDDSIIDESKLGIILKEKDLDKIASIVSSLKNYHELHQEDYKSCSEPDSCPGNMNQKTAKEEVHKKRLSSLTSRSNTMNVKMNQVNFKRAKNLLFDALNCVKRKKCDMKLKIFNKPSYSPIAKDVHKCEVIDEQSSIMDTEYALELAPEVYKESEGPSVEHPEKDGHTFTYVENKNCLQLAKLKSDLQEQHQDNQSPITFRISSRITGKHKQILSSSSLNSAFVKIIEAIRCQWVTDWSNPILDFYVNVTDSHLLLGATLSKQSLSLRPYITHITLRSTISNLMAKLCNIKPGDIILDPMCGGGTILVEAAKCYQVGLSIGGDIREDQLKIALCNLRGLGISFNLLHSQATNIPLNPGSVNAVVCDFPFGNKHKHAHNEKDLMQGVLKESCRVLTTSGRAVFLISNQQQDLLTQILTSRKVLCNTDAELKLDVTHSLSLGRTTALLVVLVKGVLQ